MMRDHDQIKKLREASRAQGRPDESPVALPRDTIASRAMKRSEVLARRALGFALDPTVTSNQAAARLVELAGAHAPTLELARVQILDACSTDLISEAAADALRLALRQTGTDTAMRLVVIGRPGAGKGTQCAPLAQHLGIPHLSTGDLLRELSTQETPFGSQVQVSMNSGHLVPDHLVLQLLEARLAEPDAVERGFLLDGFPRTVEQAETLEMLLAPKGIDAVIELVVGAETVRERLGIRARRDDTEAAVTRRLEQYEHNTMPVLAWYEARTTLLRVDGDCPPERVTAELRHCLDAIRCGRAELASHRRPPSIVAVADRDPHPPSSERPRTAHSGRARTGDVNESFAWALLQAMPDGIVMVDDGGRIILANRRAEALLGYARGELLGEPVEILIPPDRHPAHREHRARYSDAPDVRPMGAGLRLAAVHRDGTLIPVDISLSPFVEGSRRLIVAAIRPHSDAERDRLATELLDSVIHRLFSIGLTLQSVAAGPEDRLRQRVSDAIDTLDHTIGDIRTTLFNPPYLHHTGDESSPSP